MAQQGQQGTLVPGQQIAVNKYSVSVEKYLSQGGFAHVYLVRTPQPVYGTTHHVLKRIAVANDAMLTEVKKEVDIMRILKGHPNIVHLIDAAWHRMPNGQYEVFILMEFCAGGGIIDMMNRRLRERLTEAEILQIFVDVCEALAAMHNLKPALLHRDLKVENILQSSNTSFKLCDFGSTTPVSARPPSTTAEIRALEADLNRHTTLQYRAPEMVDPYLRRPVDEKSDVWALGVLLYKLCYYTTPFEEHGPLAILNVQYRIPPYPVYSTHMNTLIGSMLREHGSQRPSVFEVLNNTHRLRGTKSRFTYTIPVSPSVLAPRQQPVQPLRPVAGNTPTKNPGIQARDQVLQAIAPMRRGRPSSPTKDQASSEKAFQVEEELAWKSTVGSAPVKPTAVATDDAWNVRDKAAAPVPVPNSAAGFGDDFAEKLWDSFPANNSFSPPAPISSSYKPSPPPGATTTPGGSQRPTLTRPSITGTVESYRQPSTRPTIEPTKSSITRSNTHRVPSSGRDAFADLALSPGSERAAPQTLAEARKFRTGLASMNNFAPTTSPSGFSSRTPAPTNGTGNGLVPPGGAGSMSRPPSTRPTPSPRPVSMSISPAPSWRPPTAQNRSRTPQSQQQQDGQGSAESRFPSLEELDATFGGPSEKKPSYTPSPQPAAVISPSLPARKYKNESLGLKPVSSTHEAGIRPQQVTGVAMKEVGTMRKETLSPRKDNFAEVMRSRPTLSRKHRSSVAIKSSSSSIPTKKDTLPAAPPAEAQKTQTPSKEPIDWLTGDDQDELAPPSSTVTGGRPETPVLRDSPGKRASYIAKSPVPFQSPQEAQAVRALSPPSPSPVSLRPALVSASKSSSYSSTSGAIGKAAGSHYTTTIQPLKGDAASSSHSGHGRHETSYSPRKEPSAYAIQKQSSSTYTPRDPSAYAPKQEGPLHPRDPSAYVPKGDTPSYSARPVQVFPSVKTEPRTALSDNWSPIASPVEKHSKSAGDSSDDDEGPEQVTGLAPRKAEKEDAGKSRAKGRQSSVHDLVDLWGGPGAPPASTVQTPSRRLSIAMRSSSPQSLMSPPPEPTSKPVSSHRRQGSAASIVSPTGSSSSSRHRPQSMLSFPANSTRASVIPDVDPASSGLQPPPDARPRAARRTSISDMVHMYETKVVPSAQLAAPLHKPVPAPLHKPTPLHKPMGLKPVNVTGTGPSSSFPKVQQTGGNYHVPSSPRMARPTASLPVPSMEDSAVKNIRSPTAGLGLGKQPGRGDYLDDPMRRTPSTSSRPSPSKEQEPTPTSSGGFSFPARKSLAPPALPKEDTTRSPSPDKPYQGVGKLIDQWQRKTVEPDVKETTPRLGAIPKRAGVVAGRGR